MAQHLKLEREKPTMAGSMLVIIHASGKFTHAAVIVKYSRAVRKWYYSQCSINRCKYFKKKNTTTITSASCHNSIPIPYKIYFVFIPITVLDLRTIWKHKEIGLNRTNHLSFTWL